jgi:hypothetical protein
VTTWTRLANLTALLAFSGCAVSTGAMSAGSAGDAPAFQLPQPRTPRAPLPPEVAALAYPDASTDVRDPFVLPSEEPSSAPKPPLEATVDGPGKRPALSHATPPRPQECGRESLQKLKSHLQGSVVGAKGRTVVLDGQGYGLGDPVEKTCWVVTGIDESGMDVRSRSGALGARIPFDVRPVYIVELK